MTDTSQTSVSDEIKKIKQDYHKEWVNLKLIAIVENNGEYEVHTHFADGVCPSSTYSTKRLAASRLLQLLEIGPVAPQIEPEKVCIDSVDSNSGEIL